MITMSYDAISIENSTPQAGGPGPRKADENLALWERAGPS
jgi:hypothetical protein